MTIWTRSGRRSLHRPVIAGALATATLAFGALPATAAAQPAAVKGSGFSGTLNILGFGTNGDDVAQTRLKIAEKAIAPMKINAPNGGFEDSAFLADIASGNVPDLVYMNSADLGSYAAKGALLPLSSCVRSQHLSMSIFAPGAQAMSKLGNTLYGLPEFTDDRTLIVNNAAVQQAGLKVSDISTTNWSKLSQLAKQLTVMKNGKLQRIGFDPKLPEFFPIWVKANGGSILSANGRKAELNSPQDIAALTYAVSLIKEEGGYSKFITYRNTFNYFGSNNPFEADQLAVTPFENWMYNVIASTSPSVNVSAVPFTNRKGQPIDYETGSVWVIPKAAKHVAAACKFATTMVATSTWLAAAQNRIKLYAAAKPKEWFSGLMTGNAQADAAIIKLANSTNAGPYLQADQEVYNVEKDSFTVPASPAGEQVQNDWTAAVTQVLEGQLSPKAALDQAQQEATVAIDAVIG